MSTRSSEAPKPQLTEAYWLKTASPAHARKAEQAFRRLELAEAQGTQQTAEVQNDMEIRRLLASLKVEDFLKDDEDPSKMLVLGPNHKTMMEIFHLIKTPQDFALVLMELNSLLHEKAVSLRNDFSLKNSGKNPEIGEKLGTYIANIYINMLLETPNLRLIARNIIDRITSISSFEYAGLLVMDSNQEKTG